MRRSVGGVVAVLALVAAACGSGGGQGSVSVGGSPPGGADEGFEVVPVVDVAVGELVAAGAPEAAGEGGLVLAAAGLDSLTVRWSDPQVSDVAGFLLRWRPRRSGDEGAVWQKTELDAAAREHTIEGLEAGWRYRLRLAIIDGGGERAEVAVADFFTLATAVRDLSARATAHDAVRLRWRSPKGWSPVGYVVQWRRAALPGPFLGVARLPSGSRGHLVTGLDGGRRYLFRVTALTARGWQSAPAAARTRPPPEPPSPLVLEVSVPAYCVADEGYHASSTFDIETLEPIYQREGVASVRLQWRLSGGAEPYTVNVLGAEQQGAFGEVDVSCAAEGVDFENLTADDADMSIIRPGAKTFTVEAVDAAGHTAARTVSVEIIEDVDSGGNWKRGETLQPGRIYSHWGRFFIEVPEGARIGYSGTLSASPAPGAPRDLPTGFETFYASSSPSRNTRLLLVAGTIEQGPPELSREVCHVNEAGGSRCAFREPLTDEENEMWDRFLANMRITPFPEGDPRNDLPAPLS